MPRDGPCRVPGCAQPETDGGQWVYIPEAYCIENDLTFREACTCKRPACQRACGKMPPMQPPGRKRKGSPASPVTVASQLEEQALPRPPTVVTIDEVWADRCAVLPQPLLLPIALASFTVNIRFALRGTGARTSSS